MEMVRAIICHRLRRAFLPLSFLLSFLVRERLRLRCSTGASSSTLGKCHPEDDAPRCSGDDLLRMDEKEVYWGFFGVTSSGLSADMIRTEDGLVEGVGRLADGC